MSVLSLAAIGKRAVQSCEAARNQPENFRRDVAIGKIDEIGPERVGDDLIKAALIHEPAIDESLLDVFAVELRLLQNIVGLRRLQDPLLDKKIDDLLRVHGFIWGAHAPRVLVLAPRQTIFGKVRDREGAIASTRGACAPQIEMLPRSY